MFRLSSCRAGPFGPGGKLQRMKHDYELLKVLSETSGIPGREDAVRSVIRDALGGHAADAVTDGMGNLIVKKDGPADAPLVMVSAHMDEIGFIVSHVSDDGFLRVHNLGGFDARNLFARYITVHPRSGVRTGRINPGGRPFHISTAEERKKIPEMHDLVT